MATEKLDLRAKKLDVVMPAGDSLTFSVTVADISQIPNPVWSGRAQSSDGTYEEFTCTPTADGCAATLYPAQIRALADSREGAKQVVVGADSQIVWSGRYDIQVAYDVGLVRTFLKGRLELEEDVTP